METYYNNISVQYHLISGRRSVCWYGYYKNETNVFFISNGNEEGL